jgi:phosphoglycerol transferase MdoB-like AlkP superfamily enzyme
MKIKALRKTLPDHLRFLVWFYLILLVIYSLFRFITLKFNRPVFSLEAKTTITALEAFIIGFRFDILVASYALILPYLVLTIGFILNRENQTVAKWMRYYCSAVILFSLIICAIDIPYFKFFNSHFTTSSVNWGNLGQSFKYMATELKYYPVVVVALFGIWGVGKLILKLWETTTTDHSHNKRTKIISTIMATFLLMLGLFGGAKPKMPDMVSAYISNDGFLNQLTINPVHAWFDSYFDFNVNVYSSKGAIAKVRRDFKIKDTQFDSPIAKERNYKQNGSKPNVVLVLMESMSAAMMGIYGDQRNLTPGLDSLAKVSTFFKNCYSNGIHTNAGIYGSLYGLPIKMMQHPMQNGVSENTQFTGLPVTLKDCGYETIFFCTHPKSFDNLGIFLEKNGFNMLSDQADYPNPDSTVTNAWGVSDETLFDYARIRLNSMAADSSKPFFATILTITAHPPYTIPKWTKYKPRSKDQVEITYEYADWALKNFMDSVATEPWYDNTIFVFVGDHGLNVAGKHEVPLSYNHVPLIIHAPKFLPKNEVKLGLANQTDIFPTIMGMLQQDYVQNTLGYDLFREKRPYSIFSQDLKMGVISENFLYIARKSGRETLYDYQNANGYDVLKKYPALADSMRNFACAQIQITQELIQKKKLGVQTKYNLK